MLKKFGDKSPFWICRVLGKFFTFGNEKMIPKEWLNLARERWQRATPEQRREASTGRRILGVDVAGAGQDKSAAVLRVGKVLRVVDIYQEAHTMDNARRIVRLAHEHDVHAIHCDATAIGWGVYCDLLELERDGLIGRGIEIVPVVWGRAAFEKKLFVRLLDEIAFAAREAFDPGPDDMANQNAEWIDCGAADDAQANDDAEELIRQLNLRLYRMDKLGRYKVETKQELRQRGAGSPDVGDAAVLCFYEDKPMEVSIAFG